MIGLPMTLQFGGKKQGSYTKKGKGTKKVSKSKKGGRKGGTRKVKGKGKKC
jgi:hypothetical protein